MPSGPEKGEARQMLRSDSNGSRSTLRIAFIAPFGLQPKGTVSGRMLPLAHALAGRGHSVRIVVPAWDDPSAPHDKAVQAWQPTPGVPGAGVHIVTLPLPRRLPYSLALTQSLLRWALSPPRLGQADIREEIAWKPDVVHVFKPIGYSAMSAIGLQALGVPWVLDVDDWEGPGGWSDVNPYSAAQKLSIAFTDAALPRIAGAVTAASRTLEARAWTFGVPSKRIFYMPNGISRAKYTDWLATSAKQASEPILLLYTRFAEFPYRWPLQVLEAVQRTHPAARLLVVGRGFFNEGEKLLAEAGRMRLEGVTLLGYLPEADLPSHLSSAGVALYPMSDNLINRAKSPVKLLEQMLMGLPIVAHRVGQTPEFLGNTGVLVEAGDVATMSVAASALLSNRERAIDLGQSARRRVLQEFDWDRLSLAAEEAYRVALPCCSIIGPLQAASM